MRNILGRVLEQKKLGTKSVFESKIDSAQISLFAISTLDCSSQRTVIPYPSVLDF